MAPIAPNRDVLHGNLDINVVYGGFHHESTVLRGHFGCNSSVSGTLAVTERFGSWLLSDRAIADWACQKLIVILGSMALSLRARPCRCAAYNLRKSRDYGEGTRFYRANAIKAIDMLWGLSARYIHMWSKPFSTSSLLCIATVRYPRL